MGNKQKIYDQLKKQYSDEEIADAHIIGEELTNEEQAAANEEMRQVRMEKLKNQTEAQKMRSDLARLRILMRA